MDEDRGKTEVNEVDASAAGLLVADVHQHPNLPPCLPYQTVVFSQNCGRRSGQQAVSEAALSSLIVHPNVVATYSYSMKPIRSAVPRKEALQIEGGDQDWKLYLIQVGLNPVV